MINEFVSTSLLADAFFYSEWGILRYQAARYSYLDERAIKLLNQMTSQQRSIAQDVLARARRDKCHWSLFC